MNIHRASEVRPLLVEWKRCRVAEGRKRRRRLVPRWAHIGWAVGFGVNLGFGAKLVPLAHFLLAQRAQTPPPCGMLPLAAAAPSTPRAATQTSTCVASLPPAAKARRRGRGSGLVQRRALPSDAVVCAPAPPPAMMATTSHPAAAPPPSRLAAPPCQSPAYGGMHGQLLGDTEGDALPWDDDLRDDMSPSLYADFQGIDVDRLGAGDDADEEDGALVPPAPSQAANAAPPTASATALPTAHAAVVSPFPADLDGDTLDDDAFVLDTMVEALFASSESLPSDDFAFCRSGDGGQSVPTDSKAEPETVKANTELQALDAGPAELPSPAAPSPVRASNKQTKKRPLEEDEGGERREDEAPEGAGACAPPSSPPVPCGVCDLLPVPACRLVM